ncbi:hypothetical protein R6Q59_010164 [Mikania micrantha]
MLTDLLRSTHSYYSLVVVPPDNMNGLQTSTSSFVRESDTMSSSHYGSRRVSSRFQKSGNNASGGSAHMAETVTRLKRRCADELGAAMANSVLSSYTNLVEWIHTERLRRLPTEGSAWDKVLAWAQSFAEKFNDFDLAIEDFTGGNYDGAEIAFGYCILLLELGEDNAPALQTSFGFFFQRSLDLIALLDRAELFGVNTEITEQLILGYADLVTLVSDIALRFYQVIQGNASSEVAIDIYTAFGSTIESFQTRRAKIVEAMWSHQLTQEHIDTKKYASIKDVRSWLAVDDQVLKYKTGDHTSLVTDRQALTCLWLQPYLTRFLNSNRDSFIITGGLGSGKSVLAATIVDTLQKTATRRSYNVVFVQVDARIKTYATSTHVASSILFQLLEHRVGNIELYKIIADAYHVSQTSHDNKSFESLLWTAVEKAVHATMAGAKDTIIIVDGIDEVSDDPQALLARLKTVSSKHDKVRLIALSQPSALPQNAKPDVDMNPEMIYDDVFAVVTNLIRRSPHFTSRSQMEQDILVDQIVSASKGNILWAKMVTKSLVMENTPDKLTKAVESVKRSPKPIQDVIKDLWTTSNVSEEGKLLVLWLTISERPLTVEELSLLYATDAKRGVVNDAPHNILRTLSAVASLVFLQDGLLYLRHTIVRKTLTTIFEQNPPIRDYGLDLVLRLFTYLRTIVKEQRDPSFTSLNPSQVDQRFHQHHLTEYAVRYWPAHYLLLPSKIRDSAPDLKRELTNVLPTSPTVALIEKTVWTWLPTPTKISWHSTSIDLRRKVFNGNHPIVLQSVINLALIYHTIEDHQATANYYFLAYQFASNIFSGTHPLTIQCANHFLEVTNRITFTSRTEIVTHREEVLITLIESYTKLYGATSEQVTSLQTTLIQLYRSINEEQKAVTIEQKLRITVVSDTTDGTARGGRSSLGVRVKSGHGKDYRYHEWDFSEHTHPDTLIRIDVWQRIDELIRLAKEYAAKNEHVKAEQYYVEAWYYISQQTKSTSLIETHTKKLDLAIAYANFLKSVKRESEASTVLIGVWEEYQSLSISRTEQINTKFVEIAKVMKSMSLTTVALSVFKHCSSVYRSLNKTESSSYKEVSEYEQSTHRELLQQASSSTASASHLSEEAVTEIFQYMETSKSTTLDVTSVSAVKKIVSTYMEQRRYKEATHIIKRTLRSVWSSLFSASVEDVTLTAVNTEFSIEMAEQLITCYRLRHRLEKSLQLRERLYRALRLSRKVDDKLVQHNISELFKLYEQLRYTDKTIQLHRELLEEYKKVYGPGHKEVIRTLFILAQLTSPEPVSFEYYRQIVTILSKDSDICHHDAIEPLRIVAGHYWNERRYPGAVWAYSLLFRTFVQKGKELKIFHESTFVSSIYNRYVTSLKATTTDLTTIYQISTQYRNTCVSVFGAKHKTTIEATLYLARVCEVTKRYQAESIRLYEELSKESAASEYHAEIKETLDAIHEEQALEAARSVTVTASSEQVSRAVTVIRQRMIKNRSEYGWTHQESLEQLKEMTHLYAKQSKKEEAYKELNEATRQIISTEQSSTSLMRGASTVASSYIGINETHRGLEIAEEMRWQLITKDSSNSKKYSMDLTTSSRSAAIYIAQLEYSLRQDSTISFNEIYLSILTEIVYYEEFQRSIKSNLSMEAVFSIASRLHAFLSLHQRTVMRSHVENELVSFFIRSSGEKAKVGDVAQVKVLITTMLEYVRTHEVKSFVHSISLASIEYVRLYLHEGKQKQACDLAQTAFRYIHAVGGYKSESSIKYGLILAIAIADLDHTKNNTRQGQIQIASEIVRQLLRSANEVGMQLAGIPLHQANIFITLFGEEKDYVSLEWFLSILWNARETHRAWKPAVVLELGYRLVLARFLLGKNEPALQLATDIAYNLRRVYGATHLATLEVNILLSQLCTSTGLAFQSQKGAEEIARRYYKRAVGVHENILRSLTLDPLGLGEEDDMTVMSHEPEPMDLTMVVDKDATQGSYARKHLNLLKLALERYGGYPKGRDEYEAINADVFRSFPDELRGMEGLEKWNIEKYGAGKAESNEGTLDTNIKRWRLTENTSHKAVHANGHANGHVNGHANGHHHH